MGVTRLILFWMTAGMYLAAFFASAFQIFFRKAWLVTIAIWTLRLGFLAGLGMFAIEWIEYGQIPLHRTSLLAALFILTLQIILKRDLIYLVFFSMIPILIDLFLTTTRDPSIVMSVTHDSRWLAVHIIFAWFAFACFTVVTGLAAITLVKSYRPDAFSDFYTIPQIDGLNYRLVGLGILFEAGMIAAGMMWAKELYGRYWAWDPVEVWSLIVLVYYMMYFDARLLLKFRGKGAAWMLVLGVFLFIFSLWGLGLVAPTDHIQQPDSSFTK